MPSPRRIGVLVAAIFTTISLLLIFRSDYYSHISFETVDELQPHLSGFTPDTRLFSGVGNSDANNENVITSLQAPVEAVPVDVVSIEEKGALTSHLPSITTSTLPISYDLSLPPSVGCEDVVLAAQQTLIETYQRVLSGVRYANIWGYLETENKGDAAIWAAQQMLLSTLGITFMSACRFMHKDCNWEDFVGKLVKHAPHSAIIMAGGGNMNDFYWEDQPSRIAMISKMAETHENIPIHSFPQSIHMTHPDRIDMTRDSFTSHPNLQLAARDKPSYDWLKNTFNATTKSTHTIHTPEMLLVPDIAFMWGYRPDFRLNTPKTHDLLILSRDDWEISSLNASSLSAEGALTLPSGHVVTYRKVDWKFTPTPDLEGETGKNQRAWAKAKMGFEMLGSARFVVTDRLHGHILATIIGTPHVLLDSKLGKNLRYHTTWTERCACTRIAEEWEQAVVVMDSWFVSEKDQGRWVPAV